MQPPMDSENSQPKEVSELQSQPSGKLVVVYQEHSLKDVLDYFVRGLKPPKGITVEQSELFLDVFRGTVILKLHLKGEENKILSIRE